MNIFLLLGVLGAACVLFAFIMEQKNVWKNSDAAYDGMNAFGSALLFIYALNSGVWPFVVTNVVWCFVSCLDLFKKKKKEKIRTGISAGGVVLKKDGDAWYVALETVVGSKTHGGKWYVPKGHVEAGETLLEAAKREVEEEVGVPQSALIGGEYLGVKERMSLVGKEWKIIHYFLFTTTAHDRVFVPSNKKHDMRWVPLLEATTPLDEQNEILDEVRRRII